MKRQWIAPLRDLPTDPPLTDEERDIAASYAERAYMRHVERMLARDNYGKEGRDDNGTSKSGTAASHQSE